MVVNETGLSRQEKTTTNQRVLVSTVGSLLSSPPVGYRPLVYVLGLVFFSPNQTIDRYELFGWEERRGQGLTIYLLEIMGGGGVCGDVALRWENMHIATLRHYTHNLQLKDMKRLMVYERKRKG